MKTGELKAGCVVLDCFGTLVLAESAIPDREAVEGHLANHLGIEENRLRHASAVFIKTTLACLDPGIHAPERAAVALATRLEPFSDRVSVVTIDRMLWALFGTQASGYRAAPGSLKLLRDLGNLDLHRRLLSNCVLSREGMVQLLEDVGLFHHIDELFLSSDGVSAKPQVQAFEQARGASENVVMVGDNIELDILPAQSLGWQTVHVNGSSEIAFDRVLDITNRWFD
jgi:FMN phosphatase YigB (HAD superfamily)